MLSCGAWQAWVQARLVSGLAALDCRGLMLLRALVIQGGTAFSSAEAVAGCLASLADSTGASGLAVDFPLPLAGCAAICGWAATADGACASGAESRKISRLLLAFCARLMAASRFSSWLSALSLPCHAIRRCHTADEASSLMFITLNFQQLQREGCASYMLQLHHAAPICALALLQENDILYVTCTSWSAGLGRFFPALLVPCCLVFRLPGSAAALASWREGPGWHPQVRESPICMHQQDHAQ